MPPAGGGGCRRPGGGLDGSGVHSVSDPGSGEGGASMLQGVRSRGPARDALDWLFPRTCSLCGEVGPPHDPCTDCERSLDALLLHTVCPRCAAPLPVDPADTPAPAPCPACLERPPPFDRVVGPWSFAPPLSSLIHRMKYRRELAAAAALGRLLARQAAARPGFAPPDAVLGMPISRRRLLRRGFNHAEELAAIVRRTLGLPPPRGVRIDRRHTPPQAKAESAAVRRENVAGAFRVRRWPANLRRVAIVDDVLTTGATASALAEALRDRGVEWIEIWCCARTPLT